MRLRIVALGHRMPAWVSDAVADYAKRLPREFALELVELKPEPARPRADRRRSFSPTRRGAFARLATGARIVALDERGAPWTTRDARRAPRALARRGARRRVRHRQRRRPRSPASSATADARRRRVRDDLAARARARPARRAALPRGEPRSPGIRIIASERRIARTRRDLPGFEEPATAASCCASSASPSRSCTCARRAGPPSRRRRGSARRRARRALRRAHRAHQGDRRLEAHGATQARRRARCSAPTPRSCSTA